MTKEAALEIAKLADQYLVKILERRDEYLPSWLLYPFLFEDDEKGSGKTKLFLFLVAELLEHSTEFETIVITPTFIWNKSKKELLTNHSVVYFGLSDVSPKFLRLHLWTKTKAVIYFKNGSFVEVEFLGVDDAVHLQRLLVVHTWAVMEWPVIAQDSKTLRLLKSDFKEFNRLFFEFSLVRDDRIIKLALHKWFQRPDEIWGKDYLKFLHPLTQTAVSDVFRHLDYRLKAMSLIAPEVHHVDTKKLSTAHHVFCVRAIAGYASWSGYLDGKLPLALALGPWAKPDTLFEGPKD